MITIRLASALGCGIAALVAAAVPAQADTPAAVTAGAAASRPSAPSQQPQAQQRRSDDQRLICARIELPARRVRPRVCLTRDQWENMGGPGDTR